MQIEYKFTKKMKKYYKTVFCTAFLLGICDYSWSQKAYGGMPYSFEKQTVASIATIAMPALDNRMLLEEEIMSERKEDGYQFGKEIAVDFRLDNSGTWENLPDGGRLWRLEIQSKGALSLNLQFGRFYIPPASNLFIYTADRSFVLGSFTAKNNNKWGNFATTLLPSDAIVLEFYEAPQDKNQAILNLSTVVHGYKDFLFQKGQKGQKGNSGSCNVNVNCGIGLPYQDVKQAVGTIIDGGTAFCSGTLINNTAQDGKPYFLTAHHCTRGRDYTQFVIHFYHEKDCNGANTTTISSARVATVVARGSEESDFSLWLLDTVPPTPYYAGWNRKDVVYQGVVCIHHPHGDYKKISIDRKTIVSTSFEDNGNYAKNTHYRVLWDTGTTENGSSGSALFNANKQIIGQLEGGNASCSYRQGNDYFGKIAYSWTNNDNPDSNRLDYWLDPLRLGVEFLDGFEPNASAIVSTRLASDITDSSAILNGIITMKNDVIIEQGIEWREKGATNWITEMTAPDTNIISLEITGLTKNTIYEFRAYAKTSAETIYGVTLTFTALYGYNVINYQSKPNVLIFPNPTNGMLQVTSYELQVEKIEIFDIYGRKAPLNPPKGGKQLPCGQKPPSFGGDGGGSIVIDISHLSNGMYFIKIQTNEGVIIRKIVKE